MTKKQAWIHIGLLVGMFTATPLVSWKFGSVPGAITFLVFFMAFCYWPIDDDLGPWYNRKM